MSDKNSYKNHRENCICAACAVVGIATEVAEIIDRLESEKEQILQQMAELRAERDALRRTLSKMFIDPLAYAESKDWDCFEEKP
jgi:hypothetical protein